MVKQIKYYLYNFVIALLNSEYTYTFESKY